MRVTDLPTLITGLYLGIMLTAAASMIWDAVDARRARTRARVAFARVAQLRAERAEDERGQA